MIVSMRPEGKRFFGVRAAKRQSRRGFEHTRLRRLRRVPVTALNDAIWRAFAVLLPLKTVGMMGDGRTYEYVVGLRA